jgi:hypothetical protein
VVEQLGHGQDLEGVNFKFGLPRKISENGIRPAPESLGKSLTDRRPRPMRKVLVGSVDLAIDVGDDGLGELASSHLLESLDRQACCIRDSSVCRRGFQIGEFRNYGGESSGWPTGKVRPDVYRCDNY